jgi:indolepyruvate ferredoxin oxidoreductase beta subunit
VTKNVFITGVGGQGILTVSTIISDAALTAGFDSKKSEVHGMAQRGGSVVSHVRYGEKIYSPIIDKGHADVLISFSKLEALRHLDFLKASGILILNDQRVTPSVFGDVPVPYPSNVEEICRERVRHVVFFPAIKVAEELGNPRITNTIMLGAYANIAPEIPMDVWRSAIEERFPAKFLNVNMRGFEKGLEFSKGV